MGTLQDKIIELVNSKRTTGVGHMDVDLLTLLAQFPVGSASDVLSELVDTRCLVEVAYSLPNDHKIRSLFFPAGTTVNIWGRA